MHGFTASGLRTAQIAGSLALLVFLVCALMLLFTSAVLSFSRKMIYVAIAQNAALLVSGLPWTFFFVALAHYCPSPVTGDLVPLGSALGFVLWLRLLSRAIP